MNHVKHDMRKVTVYW